MRTKKEAKEFKGESRKIAESDLDTKERARDTRDYEAMLMDFIRKEITGGV